MAYHIFGKDDAHVQWFPMAMAIPESANVSIYIKSFMAMNTMKLRLHRQNKSRD
jgi:hypothetical protein